MLDSGTRNLEMLINLHCNISHQQLGCNQVCYYTGSAVLYYTEQYLGIQRSKWMIHNLLCVQMKKCCQGNTQISKLKYSSALNESKRSCRKFTQVQQRFWLNVGKTLLKELPAPWWRQEEEQYNFAM